MAVTILIAGKLKYIFELNLKQFCSGTARTPKTLIKIKLLVFIFLIFDNDKFLTDYLLGRKVEGFFSIAGVLLELESRK